MTLDARLPLILRGAEKPANAAEQIEFAQLCVFKKLYAAAARFYGDAFTAEPELAEAVPAGTRYYAACAAAQAGCAHGQDAEKLDDKERPLAPASPRMAPAGSRLVGEGARQRQRADQG